MKPVDPEKNRCLMLRLGGIGDTLVLAIVGRELKKRGWIVDYAMGSPNGDVSVLVDNLDIFNKFLLYSRTMNVDVVIEADDAISVESIKKDYDFVIDYRNSIENNTLWAAESKRRGMQWFNYQNSNYQNWTDLSLGWANIDPNSVSDVDKIPPYKLKDQEIAWRDKVMRHDHLLIGIQLNSSSLLRTWYHPDELPKAIFDHFKGREITILFFDKQWRLIKRHSVHALRWPDKIHPLRASAALISGVDVLICADSGYSHIAPILKVPAIVTYTTVPAWTRSKYYPQTHPIESSSVWCSPCFLISNICPRILERVEDHLTDREKDIKHASETNVDPNEVARKYKTTTPGIIGEGESINNKIKSILQSEPPCVETITSDIIITKLEEVLDAQDSAGFRSRS